MGDYFAFVAAAYGVSALALALLGLWVFLDARASARNLARLEAAIGRRAQEEPNH